MTLRNLHNVLRPYRQNGTLTGLRRRFLPSRLCSIPWGSYDERFNLSLTDQKEYPLVEYLTSLWNAYSQPEIHERFKNPCCPDSIRSDALPAFLAASLI